MTIIGTFYKTRKKATKKAKEKEQQHNWKAKFLVLKVKGGGWLIVSAKQLQ